MWKAAPTSKSAHLLNHKDVKDNRSSEQKDFDSCTFQPVIKDCRTFHSRFQTYFIPRHGVTISDSVLQQKKNSSEFQNDVDKTDQKELPKEDELSAVEDVVFTRTNEDNKHIVTVETDSIVKALSLYYREIQHLDDKMIQDKRFNLGQQNNCASSSSKIDRTSVNKIRKDVIHSDYAVRSLIAQKNVKIANYEKSLLHFKRGKEKREADLCLKKLKQLRNYERVGDTSDRIRDYSLDARRNKQNIKSSELSTNNQKFHEISCTEKDLLLPSSDNNPATELHITLSDLNLTLTEEMQPITPASHQIEQNDPEIIDFNMISSLNFECCTNTENAAHLESCLPTTIKQSFDIDRGIKASSDDTIPDQNEHLQLGNKSVESELSNIIPNFSTSSVSMASLTNKSNMEDINGQGADKDKNRCPNKNSSKKNSSTVIQRHKKMIEKYRKHLGPEISNIEKYLDPVRYHFLHYTKNNEKI